MAALRRGLIYRRTPRFCHENNDGNHSNNHPPQERKNEEQNQQSYASCDDITGKEISLRHSFTPSHNFCTAWLMNRHSQSILVMGKWFGF